MRTNLRDMQAELDQTKEAAKETASKAQKALARAANDVRNLQAQKNQLEASLATAASPDQVDRNDRQKEIDVLTKLVNLYKKNSQRLSAEAESSRVVQKEQQQDVLDMERRIRDLEMQIGAMERIEE